MGEPKSTFPDFNEIIGMAGKLFKDVQKSVSEIAEAYKEKRKEVVSDAKPESPVKAATTGTVQTKETSIESEAPVLVETETESEPIKGGAGEGVKVETPEEKAQEK